MTMIAFIAGGRAGRDSPLTAAAALVACVANAAAAGSAEVMLPATERFWRV